jgi:hypothetical protein
VGFRRYIVERSQARIFGFVYLYPASRNPDQDAVKYVRSVMRLTGDTERELGAKFNQQKFHDFILGQGLLPPALLRKAMFADFIGKPLAL